MQSSITVIIPALNEEKNIESAVWDVVPLLEKEFRDYEILIFDDGSTDRTGLLADQITSKNPKIRVLHNPTTMGLGYNYKKGVELAKKDYIIMIPGDNEITSESYENMFRLLGPKDMVIPYTLNTEIRPLGRRILSRMYTFINNFLFGTHLKYFNGTVIHKRELIQKIGIKTDSFAYQTELLVQMIRCGHSYIETGMVLKQRAGGKSKALRLKNVLRVFSSTWNLLCDVGFKSCGQNSRI